MKLLKNNLSVFALVGLAIFLLYSNVSRSLYRKDKQILVAPAQVALMKETFQKTWNRSPTQSETEAQIENFIKDEIFYKEAVAMGLDKSDLAVKRRLRQLLELMLDNDAIVYPTQAQLQTYLGQNPEKFAQDPVISFRHLYFTEQESQKASELLVRLNQGEQIDLGDEGQLSMIPDQFRGESRWSVERTFGQEFTLELFDLGIGDWQGPIRSAYGWHLVIVTDLKDGNVPPLEAIRDEVEREWTFERKQMLKEEQYQKIKEKYEVIIE